MDCFSEKYGWVGTSLFEYLVATGRRLVAGNTNIHLDPKLVLKRCSLHPVHVAYQSRCEVFYVTFWSGAMLTPTDLPHYTYDDYILWEGRWEMIEGIPYAMTPSPSFRHQRVSQKIARFLDMALDDCEHCRAVLPVDWKVAEDTVLQPDNMVLCYEPAGPFLTKAPALIFEVLSASTAAKDRRTKFSIYEREGVAYYCLVDPETEVAKIYRLHEGRYVKQMDATDETFKFDLGRCAFEIEFARIWAD